ncbi:hypothetical protein EDB81DRAFT_766298 [Dactylonectria macrodidyma]|uniref:Uncharacterized protein n=1 Tax=Dactylonectria macrodidyma TaxID=307937 RepID=A0A9P9DLJ8_9HYPO|nr:hypothetical protein EDB81DRAFT_766298 [Dactylonectria macrodidyma]
MYINIIEIRFCLPFIRSVEPWQDLYFDEKAVPSQHYIHQDKKVSLIITAIEAGSGIGFATAKYLYEQGARILVTDIKEELLQNALSAIADGKGDSDRIITPLLDVCVSEQADGWIEKTTSHFGTVDGAVNVTGEVEPMPV